LLNKPIPVHTHVKTHFIFSLIVGVWLVIFLVLIAPFDTSDLSFKVRLVLLPPYGLIFSMVYMIGIVIQQWLYHKYQRWTLGYELIVLGIIYVLGILGCYAYYKTGIINGTYSFVRFTLEVYFPILTIISTILLFGRWYISRPSKTKSEKIVVRGDSKMEVLQVDPSAILAASSAQNYVEVYYLQGDVQQSQVLRKTLKKVQEELPQLVQVHRSHLINPNHFVQWKGHQYILVGTLEIPVSKKYKAVINALI